MRLRFAGTIIVAVLVPSLSSAATITLDAASRGAYRNDGVAGTGNSGTAIGNYLTGQLTTFGVVNEYRGFYIFDLSTVTGPILSATFQVSKGTYLGDTSETVALFDVSSSLPALAALTGGVAAFADLGSGTSYGSRAFTAADPLVTPLAIALNAAALANLNAAAGGNFALGSALTTILGTSDQLVFAGTTVGYTTRLVLETGPTPTVPEPFSLLLLGSGLTAMAARKRFWQSRTTDVFVRRAGK